MRFTQMRFYLFVLFLLAGFKLSAQDAVVFSEGNFVRGEIKGTNFEYVALQKEDGKIEQYSAKDVASFLWNGQTYMSKPIILNKKPMVRFFKLVESGTINLYTMGDMASTDAVKNPKIEKRSNKPQFSVGMGTGGYTGMGGGISFGNGGYSRAQDALPNVNPGWRISYFIEKPGAGPIQEIWVDPSKLEQLKRTLLQKMGNDTQIATAIKNAKQIDEKQLPELVKVYNESNPAKF